VRQQSKWFARWNQSLRRSPNSNQFSEIVGDDFPVLHAADSAAFALQTAITKGLPMQSIAISKFETF